MAVTTGGIIKTVGITIAFGLISEVCYQSYLWWKKKYRTPIPKKKKQECEVLFFPDNRVACKSHFIGEGCGKLGCHFSHEPNSLSKLFEYLTKARKSLDVCVFVFTCSSLADILVEAHKKGVVVRVITDDEQVDVSNSQIWKLRKEGIIVRTDRSSFFMHHKFVVVDQAFLMNGSFNWTNQAITGNQENLMITYSTDLVQQYSQEFDKLWKQFNPQNFIS
ncbi:hypothetical protein ScPMuIL_003931 [Solemya velum]